MLTKVAGSTSGFAAYMILYERVDQCCRMCGDETRKRVCDSCKMLVSRNRNKELTCKKNRKCWILGSRIKCTNCRLARWTSLKADTINESPAAIIKKIKPNHKEFSFISAKLSDHESFQISNKIFFPLFLHSFKYLFRL